MKRQAGFYLTNRAHEWLKVESKERGISKSDVVQEWINGKIEQRASKDRKWTNLEGKDHVY